MSDFYTRAIHSLLGWLLRARGMAAATIAVIAWRRVCAWVSRLLHDGRALLRVTGENLRLAASERPFFCAMLALAVAGPALRVAFLSFPMRYDDRAAFLFYAARPLRLALTSYPEPGNHLLKAFLVNLSTRLFGSQPWAIRLPAFYAGVLMIPLAYLVVRKLYGARAALLTAAVVAGSASMVEYSTNSRSYSFLTACFLVLVGGADWVRRHDNWAAWALGFYAVPTVLYGIGIVFTALLLSAFFGEAKAVAPWGAVRRLAVAGLAMAIVGARRMGVLASGHACRPADGAGVRFLCRLGADEVLQEGAPPCAAGCPSLPGTDAPRTSSCATAAGMALSVAAVPAHLSQRVDSTPRTAEEPARQMGDDGGGLCALGGSGERRP